MHLTCHSPAFICSPPFFLLTGSSLCGNYSSYIYPVLLVPPCHIVLSLVLSHLVSSLCPVFRLSACLFLGWPAVWTFLPAPGLIFWRWPGYSLFFFSPVFVNSGLVPFLHVCAFSPVMQALILLLFELALLKINLWNFILLLGPYFTHTWHCMITSRTTLWMNPDLLQPPRSTQPVLQPKRQ